MRSPTRQEVALVVVSRDDRAHGRQFDLHGVVSETVFCDGSFRRDGGNDGGLKIIDVSGC